MNQIERRHKSLLSRHAELKKELVKKDRELIQLRRSVKKQYLVENMDNSDLFQNIKNYLDSEFLIDIASRCRKQNYVKARTMLFWFGKRYTTLTLNEMSSYVGNIDHSTIIHSLKIAEDYIIQDKDYPKQLKRHDEWILSNLINPVQQSI